MAKFLSHDGVDSNGIRAQVMVQTGTGRIKELVGRGRPGEDGTYRNVEVVFDPDNPHLKRKVYALLDTTAKELHEYVQEALAGQRDIAYRIESQRKRGVDRATPFDDLQHTEEVVRVLAAVDMVFSHEAKTNPKEDPSGDNPSALDQAPGVPVAPGAGGADRATVLRALSEARRAGLSDVVVDTLVAHAMATGASVAETQSAGFDPQAPANPPAQLASARMVALEEKPWMAFNSDGRVNAGSYMVAHAAAAEQFSLDHLIMLYSQGKKSPVDVSDEMIAQAASLALELLACADEVQVSATGGRADRQKNSYGRALTLVLDAVGKRYPVPIGGNDQDRVDWHTNVVAESAERLYGVIEVSQGRLPASEAERQAPAPPTAPESPQAASDLVAAELGGIVVAEQAHQPVSFQAKSAPAAEDPDFEPPSDEQVNRVRALCAAAGVLDAPKAISDWLEAALGVRATRKAHAPVLEDFLTHYEAMAPDSLRAEVGAGIAA